MGKKSSKVYIVGHKNPDTDSICSAIAYAHLKREVTGNEYVARRAGQINEETHYVLQKFKVDAPDLLQNVKLQVKDMDIHKIDGIEPNVSIKDTWAKMKENNVKTIPILKDEELVGVISTVSKYVLKRLAMLIPVLIGVTFMVYFILSLSPGDTAAMIAGESADAETIEATRKDLGLDQPVIVQYGKYMLNLLHGDMGKSYKTKRDVFPTIMAAFPNTAKLAFWSILVAVAIALPIGIISATRQYSAIDNVGMVAALLGVATPNFWLGLMLIIVFSLNLGWLPSGGMGSWKNYIMPAITLGTGDAALICRMTRSSMLEVIRQDYIRTARAKGVPEKMVIRKHALKNALIPVVTVIGLQFGSLLGGATLTETVFAWPGVGRLLVDSIKSKDAPLVLGGVIMMTITFSIVNLCVDILYAFIDPRIKAQYKKK